MFVIGLILCSIGIVDTTIPSFNWLSKRTSHTSATNKGATSSASSGSQSASATSARTVRYYRWHASSSSGWYTFWAAFLVG
uniref:Putative secreted protein n=1 Tax=Panstrongylus lignarius TaxID=156445 RepID=A0A224XSS2_9HEMI